MRDSIAACVLIVACTAVTGLSGCKAKEAKSTEFTNNAKMTHDPSLPFHRVWRKPGFDKVQYTKLYVADVDTTYALKNTEWQKGERKQDFEKDLHELGEHARQTLVKAFRDDPNHRFEVLDHSSGDRGALILEVALTEVVPSKVVLNALGYAPFGIGLTISAIRGIAEDRSTVAFEARIRDAATQEIVVVAADREAEQTAVVSTKGLTWYSHAYGIIDTWAKQFVQVANRKPGEVIEDTKPFTLKPW